MHVIPCSPTVTGSERRAIERLRSGLIGYGDGGEWVLLTNLIFSVSPQLQSDEIDIVVIGPPGVRVIEVKHWNETWMRHHTGRVDKEAERVTSKTKRIAGKLRKHVPDFPYVASAFLITDAADRDAPLPEVVRGVPVHGLKAWQAAAGVGAPAKLSAEEIRLAARVLEPGSGVALDGELRRFGVYTDLKLQTDPTERFHRVYRGRHATRQEGVVLHLYDRSASDDRNAEGKARREFDALHRLQQHRWAPRIVDSFQDAPEYPGEMAFFTAKDPAAPSAAERAADGSWDAKARAGFARGAVRALGQLHGAGAEDAPMLHRNLTPRTVLVRHDNTPILTGFEYARIPGQETVASADARLTADPSAAPEVRDSGRSAADRRSDVYSLCASLRALFAGEDRGSQEVARILAGGAAQDPSARLSLPELDRELSAWLGESVSPVPPPPAQSWSEDQLVRFAGSDYRIVASLGSGGIGTAFKVVQIDRGSKEDLGTYVAKVVHDRRTGNRVLPAHRRVRAILNHAGLSTIYEVARQWRDNNFAALLTWIEGAPVAEYSGLLRELAEDQQEASEEALALRWVRTACTALDELHRNGWIHGDVSPRNLILSGVDVVLTDYDCVSRIDGPIAAPGTIPFCAPSYRERLPAARSDDFYALAASIFFVLFDREPFQHRGDRAKERGLNWDGLPRDRYPVLAAFLDRATDPDRGRRFATAQEALAALDAPVRDGSRPADAAAGRDRAAGGQTVGDQADGGQAAGGQAAAGQPVGGQAGGGHVAGEWDTVSGEADPHGGRPASGAPSAPKDGTVPAVAAASAAETERRGGSEPDRAQPPALPATPSETPSAQRPKRRRGALPHRWLAAAGLAAAFTASALALVLGGDPPAARVLFFGGAGGELAGETRYLPRRDGRAEQLRLLVDELILGPRSRDFAAALPRSTAVRSVMVHGDAAYVDLSAAAWLDAPDSGLQGADRLRAVASTLLYNAPWLRQAWLLVDGQTPVDPAVRRVWERPCC